MKAGHFHVFQFMLNKVAFDSQQLDKLISKGIKLGRYHLVTYAIKQRQTIAESYYQKWLAKAIMNSQYHLSKKLMKQVTPNDRFFAIAAGHGQYHILKLLLKKWRSLTEFSTHGEIFRPPAVNGEYHCIKLFLKWGLSPELPDNNDKKPTWYAAKECHWEVLQLLIDNSNDKDQETLDFEELLKLMLPKFV